MWKTMELISNWLLGKIKLFLFGEGDGSSAWGAALTHPWGGPLPYPSPLLLLSRDTVPIGLDFPGRPQGPTVALCHHRWAENFPAPNP